MATERINITINNWQKWNPRKDYRRPTWFAMSNDLLDHPDFADFTPLEFHALIYIFSQASKRNSPTLDLVLIHARQRNISDEVLIQTLEKLERIQVLTVTRSESVQNPNASVQNPNATDRKTERQEEQEDPNANGSDPNKSSSSSSPKSEKPKLKTVIPESYQAFADQFDEEKAAMCRNAEAVFVEIGIPVSPGWRNLIPSMLRAVNWDPEQFAELAAQAKAQFDAKDPPPPINYREVTLKRMFGLLSEVS